MTDQEIEANLVKNLEKSRDLRLDLKITPDDSRLLYRLLQERNDLANRLKTMRQDYVELQRKFHNG